MAGGVSIEYPSGENKQAVLGDIDDADKDSLLDDTEAASPSASSATRCKTHDRPRSQCEPDDLQCRLELGNGRAL